MGNAKRNLKVSIKTFGCQMNMYDSEVAEGLLQHKGFELVSDTNPGDPKADIILMNTCSVREHAEDRVHGRLGMLGKVKRKRPDLIVGLMGCMVEEHREALFRRYPQLDLMVGTRNIRELPALIEEVRKTRHQAARIKQDGLSIEYTSQIKRQGKFHAWLPIMTGCDKVCTFCIVPITRGAEVSMPAREVYKEASRLAGEGVKWITLLGQNVNSYRGGGDGFEHASSFPELLDLLCRIEGLQGISFTTSHPHDATDELFRVIARNPKISRRFHLPLQSGSDRILKRMKRLHTYQDYKGKIDRMRAAISDVVVTTDIIAGFSGETEEDHAATVAALKEIRYDDAFIYKYSMRTGTPAAKLPDDIPLAVKEERNRELLEVQTAISDVRRKEKLGLDVEVFVEDFSRKNYAELIGRSAQDIKVVFPGTDRLVGTVAKVRLNEIRGETFAGSLLGPV